MNLRNCIRYFRCLLLLVIAPITASAATHIVTTVAGGFTGDGLAATSASLTLPSSVARDGRGNIYISEAGGCRIRKVNTTGVISTFAGTGICGFSGDGGPAKAAKISNVYGIAFDGHGALFLADGSRIRKINPGGDIHTVAGNGIYGYSGDGGPATQASLSGPEGVFVDSAGNIYIADTFSSVVRKVDTAGIIHTVAGNHTTGFSGDGGPATAAALFYPWSVVAANDGSFYICDINNNRVRKVDSSGIISTYAGNGQFGDTGSGGPATLATIGSPFGLLLNSSSLYLATISGDVWEVNLSTQVINKIAGMGVPGFNGDGNTALSTTFDQPRGIGPDGSGGVLVADSANNRVRDIHSNQVVTTFAGGNVGDGGPGTKGSLNFPFQFSHISVDSTGNVYIADTGNCRVRKLTSTGTLTTIAGTGICGYSGDGGPANAAMLSFPEAVVSDSNGNVFIADSGNSFIRKIDSSGTITSFVFSRATAMTFDGSGNLYTADGIISVSKISPQGVSTVIAGGTGIGYNGDGIPATQAWLNFPSGVAVDAAGNVYISDEFNSRIRKVDSSGIISTVAGTGGTGFSGDGGQATSATLFFPSDITVDRFGNLYISDWLNFRVRIVDSAGVIDTIVGRFGFGYNGNGLPALQTNVEPFSVALGPKGKLYFVDQASYLVRQLH